MTAARWTIAGTTPIIDALVEADLIAAAERAAEHRAYVAEQVGLPGIERGAHLTYFDDSGLHRGTFSRVASYGYRSGRRFRLAYYRIEIIATGGQTVHVEPAWVERTAPPALPVCGGFAGTGRRCAACKIHRNIHN